MRSRRTRRSSFHVAGWLGLAALAGLVVVPTAAAQSLDEARQHYMAAEFEEAVAGFTAVLESPSLTAATATEAHRHLAALRQLLGDAEAASRHARAATALDPTATAPEGAPAEVAALFEGARASQGGRARLRVEAPDGLALEAAGRVVASLVPAPEGLVAELRLRCASGGSVEEERGAPPSVELRIAPSEREVLCRASGRTEAGAALFEVREELVAGEESGAAAAPVAGGGGGGDDGLAIGLGVGLGLAALAAVGVVLAVVFLTAPENASVGAPTVMGW